MASLKLTFALICCIAPSLGACSRDDRPTVVLYASADEHVVRQVIDAFEEHSEVRVLVVGDTEVKKTTGLVERLRAEKDKPQADVFWSSEIFQTIDLANEDSFEPFASPSVADWPKQYRDAEGKWYGFAARARVIVYAPDRVATDVIPKTWMNLTDSRLRDRIVMADPRFGTTGGHLGAMQTYWDREVVPGYYAAFIEGLADNHVRLLPSGNAGVVEAVGSGEADVGLTDTDDVWAAQAQGKKVEMIFPAHDIDQSPRSGGGTLLIPNTVAMIKHAPHPDQAKKLMEFLLSEQVERKLAESVSHNLPLRPSLGGGDKFPQCAIPNPLKIDYERAAQARTAGIQLAMKMLGEKVGPAVPGNAAR